MLNDLRPFFEDLDAHPKIAADFDALIGPAGHGISSPNFEITGGWESIRTVADVGGGTGVMLAEILRAHPHIKGILIDRPKTVARSAEIFEAAGVSDRVATACQSFFDPLPPGADLYLLRGKPRTVSEFTVLACQSGLEVVSAGQQPDYFVVECRKITAISAH